MSQHTESNWVMVVFIFLCLAPLLAYKVGLMDGHDDCRAGRVEP